MKTEQKRTILPNRIICMLVAALLCVGLTPAVPAAYATNPAQVQAATAAGQATLTIVYGLDFAGSPSVKLNKIYAFYDGATMEDLLAAAKAAGDITDYTLNGWGGAGSVTFSDGTVAAENETMSLYWANFVGGAYAADTVKSTSLANGESYQLAWCSYPTAAAPHDWSAVGTPTAGSGIAGTPSAKAGSATLAIVYGLDFAGNPSVKLNKTYEFYQGATMEDLLAAAKAAGDITDYTMNGWGGAGSVTFPDGTVVAQNETMSLYWANFVDGAYADGSVADTGLADGKAYQLAWCSYPTAVAPEDWSTVGTPSAGQGTAGSAPHSAPAENTPTDNAAARYADVMKNIAAAYNGCGTGWQAMDMAAAGRASQVDREAVLAEALAAYNQPGTTNIQAAIIAVTALGYDAAALSVDGKTIDLVGRMAESPVSTQLSNGQAFALLAYACGNYTVPATATLSVDDLLNNLKAAQLADGGFAFSGTSADPDMTAMVISALQPYADKPGVADLLDKALAALRALQNADGGWGGTWPASTGATNANSTAIAIVALCSMGVNPATQWATENGATPLGALLAQANSDQTGFLFNGKTDELATEQAFRALVAYQGMSNTAAAYNIYTQAAQGRAVFAEGEAAPVTETPDTPKQASTPSVAKAAATAKTADDATAAATACSALCALALATVALRRSRRAAHEKVK